MNKITYGAELEKKMKKRLDELCKCAQTSGDAVMGNIAGGYKLVYDTTKYARIAQKRIGKYVCGLLSTEYRTHLDNENLDWKYRKLINSYREGMEEAMTAMGLVAYEDPELFGIQIGYPKKEKTAA